MATTNYEHARLGRAALDTRTIPMAVPILTAISLVVAGVLFVAYPALRPFSSETGLEGAQAFASTNWIIAHSLAMAGFILLGLGLLGVLRAPPWDAGTSAWRAGAWCSAGSASG